MSEAKSLLASLCRIQAKLSVPKTHQMRIGGGVVLYRNAEDIFSALKPHLAAEGCAILVQCIDQDLGQLRCDVTLYNDDGESIATGFTVPVDANGSTSGAQRKGAARSYALKYALCNLFAIDDGIDDDTLTNDQSRGRLNAKSAPPASRVAATKEEAIAEINKAGTMAELVMLAAKYSAFKHDEDFANAGREAQERITQKGLKV